MCTMSARRRRGSSPSWPPRHPDSTVPTDPARLRTYFDVHATSPTSSRSTCRSSTWSVPRRTSGCSPTRSPGTWPRQNIRYAELTVTPYTSMLRGIAAEAFCEAIEDARVAAERELGVVLRWIFDIPGEAGLPAADETLRIATGAAAGRAGRVRARRAGDRRTAAAVQAALRRRPRGRAAQRAARRRDDRAGDDLGRAPRPGRRADRPRHSAVAGPRAGRRTSPSTGSRSRSARRRTRHPRRPLAGRAPAAARWSRPGVV